MLWDEAGAHVSSLELRVARKTQQKVNVRVQSHDLKTGEKTPTSPTGCSGLAVIIQVVKTRLCLTLY